MTCPDPVHPTVGFPQVLAPWNGTYSLKNQSLREYLKGLHGAPLSLVYIAATHRAYKELELLPVLWQKLHAGGQIGGYFFNNHNENNWGPCYRDYKGFNFLKRPKDKVIAFARRVRRNVYWTKIDDVPSWYFVK